MSLWVLLWFVLSFILLGTTIWSTVILVQQKAAWKKFAQKHKLTFTSGKFFQPAGVEGVMEGYNVSLFTATQQREDARKNRQLTVMQVNVNQPFVDGIASGTDEILPFLQSLDGITPHDMKSDKWNKKNHIRTRNKKAVDAYLSDERVALLSDILSMPNADVLVMLDENEGVFRFETSNPLMDAEKIETLFNKLFARIKKLQPDEAELKKLVEMSVKREDSVTADAPD